MFIKYENNAFNKKWPSLVAKFGKMKKKQIFIGLTPEVFIHILILDIYAVNESK